MKRAMAKRNLTGGRERRKCEATGPLAGTAFVKNRYANFN